MSKLYIVGTPIGNLSDLSPRAGRVLGEVDFIAAEDTRVSGKLLQHLGIKKPMVSYYQHNMRERGQQIIDRIAAGESCAIITDAGMPCISDPGEDLVRLCHDQSIPIEVVPGPTAAMSALAASGLATGRFAFEGFLSVKASSRREHLAEVQNDPRTLIFYEAPHKLRATLTDMSAAFGADRPVTLARELTKLYEEITRPTLGEAVELYKEREPRGEFVLIVGGAAPKAAEEQISRQQAAEMIVQLNGCGVSLSDAAKQVAADTGYKKGELYKLAQTLLDSDTE
ncbi:MAG: 16S rRNA (cytidine(1402)-2'-O)-methyltransferase [Angelakisella sp.]